MNAPLSPQYGEYSFEALVERSSGPTDREQLAVSVVEAREPQDAAGTLVKYSYPYSKNPEQILRIWANDGVFEYGISSKRGGTCTWNPPIELLPLPIRSGELSPQRFEGTDCDAVGTSNVRIEGDELVADASGKRWKTSKIVEDRLVRSSGAQSRETGTMWFSTELGVEIKSVRTVEIKYGLIRGTKTTKLVLKSGA